MSPFASDGIALDIVEGRFMVSTVRLSLVAQVMDSTLGVFERDDDDPFDPTAAGEFETMVFACNEDGEVRDWENPADFTRYETEEAARDGHAQAVAKWEVLAKLETAT